MNLNKRLSTVLTLIAIGSAISAFGQTIVYEQSRTGATTGGANNPDFTYVGVSSSISGTKSTAPGLPSVATSSRFANSTPSSFTVSPNNTIAGNLVNGTTYAVDITFGLNSGTSAESSTIVVAPTATGVSSTTFPATTSAFKSVNGANTWVNIGNITVNSANPTVTFAYFSGTVARFYFDSVRFTPVVVAPIQSWDTGGVGGTGTWDTTTTNWNPNSDGSGVRHAYIQADLSVFAGTPGTVSIDGAGITTDGGLQFDVAGYLIQDGPLTLGLGTNIAVVGSGNTATISSVVTGINGLNTTGLGTLVLGTTNNLIGTVTLSTGTLSLGTNQTFTSLAGNPAGTLALNTNTLTVGDANNTAFSGAISDTSAAAPGSLVKQGSGALVLSGTSTFHGTTTVNEGALTIALDAALGTKPASVVADQIRLDNGARLDFSASFLLSARRGIRLGSGGGVFSTPGTGTVPTIGGNISGPGSLTIPSGGFELAGSNTFSGNVYLTGTAVDSGGNNLSSIRFSSSTALGTGKLFVSPLSAFNCTLRTITVPEISVTNDMQFDTGGGLYLSGAYVASASSFCTINFSGNINGNGGATIGNSAANQSNPGGAVILSGSNSAWSGSVTLQVATLGLGSSNALGTGIFHITPIANSNVTLLATTPLTGASAVTNPTRINLATGTFSIGGTNSLELAGPITLYGSLAITDDNTGDSILSGGISDSVAASGFSLTTAGSGTLTLSGASTYDGGTTVSSGTLKVNNTTDSGTGTGAVMVNTGATLGGSGIISGTVAVDGSISPGNSPGALATADETWGSGGSYTWEINQAGGTAGVNPGWDLLNITGGLAVAGGFTVNLKSLTLANAPGAVADFDNTKSYTWSIAHTTTGISGLAPGVVTLNPAGFANSLGQGAFIISSNATDVLEFRCAACHYCHQCQCRWKHCGHQRHKPTTQCHLSRAYVHGCDGGLEHLGRGWHRNIWQCWRFHLQRRHRSG